MTPLSGEGTQWVIRLEPGAIGPSLSWSGEQHRDIEILTPGCDVVGVLRMSDGRTYGSQEIPGLEGTVEPFRLLEQTGEGMIGLEECGGKLLLETRALM